MTFDLKRIIESKRKARRELAARPIAEKLALLDMLRERELAIRSARAAGIVQEAPSEYGDARSQRNTPRL